MKTIIVIAENTFKEAIRDKILYGILGFAILYLLLTLFLSKLSLEELPMIKSFGLAGIYIFGVLITIFLGASLIFKEIERRTLYFVISKPVSRTKVILGKFFGLYAAVVLTTAVMTIFYLLVISYKGGGIDEGGLLAVVLELFELMLLTAMLTFFSAIMAPLLATISAIMLLFIGHLINEAVETLQAEVGGLTAQILSSLRFLLPNLEKFNARNIVVHGLSIEPAAVLAAIVYAVIYSALLLYLASIFFKKREL